MSSAPGESEIGNALRRVSYMNSVPHWEDSKRLLEENRRLEELVRAATSMAECAEEERRL
jgi:hypothetical protein